MNHRSPRTLGRVSLLAAAAVTACTLALPGCGGSKGLESAPEVANASSAFLSLRALRDNLSGGQGRLFQMSETLRQATAPQDLPLVPWFGTYREQRQGLVQLAMDLRTGYADLEAAERVYISKWEQDLATISNPQLRQQSVERRAALRDRFGRLESDLDNTKQQFQPLLQTLSDLEIYLQNDLTSTGVAQVKQQLGSVAADSETLGRKVSTDLAKLDELIAELTPQKG